MTRIKVGVVSQLATVVLVAIAGGALLAAVALMINNIAPSPSGWYGSFTYQCISGPRSAPQPTSLGSSCWDTYTIKSWVKSNCAPASVKAINYGKSCSVSTQVKAKVVYPCKETGDQGKDYYVKGTAKIGITTNSDQCFTSDFAPVDSSQMLMELYCTKGDGLLNWEFKACDCQNGACSSRPAVCPSDYRAIYVSTSGSDANSGSGEVNSVKTLDRATQLAKVGTAGACILLKAGDTFTNFTSHDHPFEQDAKSRYAFIWDVNKPLVLSSFGDGKAIIKQKDSSSVPSAVIIAGSNKNTPFDNAKVTISNLQFENWQARVISISHRSNVDITNNLIQNVGTKFLGDSGTANKSDSKRVYGDGVIYPKDADHLVFDGNVMKNMINNTAGSDNKYDDIHAFYMTRVNNVIIKNNVVDGDSGPAVKPGKGGGNIQILNNKFYHISPYSGQSNYDQLGFIRLDGGDGNECPSGFTIKGNEFKYPLCSGDSCAGKEAKYCSEVKCGSGASCSDIKKLMQDSANNNVNVLMWAIQ